MKTSLFEIFKVGLGPSSSHTVGPMKAANHFVESLKKAGKLNQVGRLVSHLYGSLALTGRGHATDRAVQLGLTGATPEGVALDSVESTLMAIEAQKSLNLLGLHSIPYDPARDIVFHPDESMPDHPNGLRFEAIGLASESLLVREYYSVGGGAITVAGESSQEAPAGPVPYPFTCADELLSWGERSGLAIWEIGLANELAWHTRDEIEAWVSRIWEVMQQCVDHGLKTEGVLPGGLLVNRRAPHLAQKLQQKGRDPLSALDWVDAFAMASNEENAAGRRVVTAPTNGSAGIIPAVAHYYQHFIPDSSQQGLFRFFITAAVIGTLYKENASISGADVGCQGEVGVACSMAAGGLVAAMGGDNRHVEKAAEIGMEHHLGMTCDPVGGLVQIPCIERNAMGAVQAINASRLAMLEDGNHKVSLDRVIKTMLLTGKDMASQYKETSLGGLAVNVPLC